MQDDRLGKKIFTFKTSKVRGEMNAISLASRHFERLRDTLVNALFDYDRRIPFVNNLESYLAKGVGAHDPSGTGTNDEDIHSRGTRRRHCSMK